MIDRAIHHYILPVTMVSLKLLLLKINSCPAEPRFINFFENTVDPDQLASDEAI